MKLRSKLDEYYRTAAGLQRLNGEQAVNIMRLVRRIIERDGSAASYPRAKLFGDWLQHNEINNPVALCALEQINRLIFRNIPPDLAVPMVLGTGVLRDEMILIFSHYDLDDRLLQTASIFIKFMSLLLEEYVECPIGFPDQVKLPKKVQEIYDRIERETREAVGPGAGLVPILDRLSIQMLNDSENHIGWQLEFRLPDGARIGTRGIIPVLSAEFKVNDLGLAFASLTDRTVGANWMTQLFELNQEHRAVFIAADAPLKH